MSEQKNESRDGIKNRLRDRMERDKLEAKPDSWRYGVWCTDYRGQQCRGKDLASTYVLHPHQRTRLSLILQETSRGDTRGLYCQGEY